VPWYRRETAGIVVAVRLTPKADRDAIEGTGVLADGREVVRVRVRAVPEVGAANKALVRLIAEALKHPKSAVEVVSGATQRLKQIRIAGDPDDLVRRVEALLVGKSYAAAPRPHA
jgi:uncharacterized protein (TIGR00251 family)